MSHRRPIARSRACRIACSLGVVAAAAPAGGASLDRLPSGDEGRPDKWVVVRPPPRAIALEAAPPAAAARGTAPAAANRPPRLSSPFGFRLDPISHVIAFHPGIDLPAPRGAPVFASADGSVVLAGWRGGYGRLVELDHGRGLRSLYGHLDRILVAVGARVLRGELIGRVGSTGRATGPHLHFEVRIDGASVNPLPLLSGTYRPPAHARDGNAIASARPSGDRGGALP